MEERVLIMKSNKKTLLIIACAAVIIIAGIAWFGSGGHPKLKVHGEIEAFELEEALSETVYQSDNGLIKLLAFIFINCPDGVCPMTMMDFEHIQNELKDEGLFGTEVELLTITFDPVRDTTEALQQYAGYFNADQKGWRFLRGDEEKIQSIADELKFFYAINEEGAGMHATTMYIIDADHQIRAYHRMSSSQANMDREQIMKDLRALVHEKNKG